MNATLAAKFMSLTPDEKELVDSTIRRRVAAATLKNLQRQLENDAREESAAERSAGRAIAIVLALLALVIAYLLVATLVHHLQTGVSSPASLTPEALKAACYMALISGALAVAAYVSVEFRASALRFITVAGAIITIGSASVAALYFLVIPVSG